MNMFDPKLTAQIVFPTDGGKLNTDDEVILAQVVRNIRLGLPQLQPHDTNPETAILVCGGPSLAEMADDLRQASWEGGKVVAVNGAYQWCIDHAIRPSAVIMLDAREFNSRFVETPVPGCKYLLASQCHPRAFDLCADRETFIWHAVSCGDIEVDLLKAYYFGNIFPITLGTTVGIRAISLLRMLGFYSIDIFGLDSCFIGKDHHAYAQAENDRDRALPVWLRPEGRDDLARRFMCAPWHIKQAEDFGQLIRTRGDLFQLRVRGPGLIAEMLRTGAQISTDERSQDHAAV